MAVVLADLLDEESVALDLGATTRDEALRDIVETMRLPDAPAFLDQVITREAAQTTFMGRGLAFPHARTELVKQIVLGIGRSLEGVPFGEKGESAHLIFVVGVPQRMVTDYLVCVGGLARLVSDDARREALMAATTAAEFIELLRIGSLLLE